MDGEKKQRRARRSFSDEFKAEVGNDPPGPRESDRVERGEARGRERLWAGIAVGVKLARCGDSGRLPESGE